MSPISGPAFPSARRAPSTAVWGRLTLAALALAFAGCTCSNSAPCDAALCEGCCDKSGVCRPGGSQLQCGLGGKACVGCASGEACQQGACTQTRIVPDAGRCTAVECMNGTACDDVDGVCRCGGTTCAVNQFCDAGSCVNATDGGSVRCDFLSCRGCCITQDTCAPGVSPTACGVNGNACAMCPAGSNCNFGFCNQPFDGGGGCFNCFGCCLNGSCLTGDSPGACGRGGAICQNCGTSLTCLNGFCQVPCGPQTCMFGCCDQFEQCTGISDFSCALPGGKCTSCSAVGARCLFDAGVCSPICNPSTCPGGCCEGDTCVPAVTQSDQSCGSNGEACHSCSSPSSCGPNGLCTNPDGGVCSLMSCDGCCDSAECRPHNTDQTCGQLHTTCKGCDAGESCQVGFCGRAPPSFDGGACGPQNCGGCCSGGVCASGFFDPSFCGRGGQQCTSCDIINGQVCDFAACVSGSTGSRCGPVDAGGGGCASFLSCRSDGGFVNGYCTTACGDGGFCGFGSGVCVGSAFGAECRKTCFSQAECRPQYRCVHGPQVPFDAGVCEPACTNPGATCPGATVCQPSGLCQ